MQATKYGGNIPYVELSRPSTNQINNMSGSVSKPAEIDKGIVDWAVQLVPLPKAYPIQDMAPVLHAFERLGNLYTYGRTPSEVVTELTRHGFLKTRQVVFIVHGFRNDLMSAEWMREMKDAILKQGDKTVILVGWGEGAKLSGHKYLQAASNTQEVGAWLAKYAIALKQRDLYIYGIGHSLGAHLVGKAGRDSHSFDRITGLDPAGPAFERSNKGNSLGPKDATFVDVIHTDCFEQAYRFKALGVDHLGHFPPLGAIDFYPNFGHNQPGCPDYHASHHRAVDLFTWSIANPGKFNTTLKLARAPKIESPVKDLVRGPAAEMGYYADQTECCHEGLYYLKTNAAEPWVR